MNAAARRNAARRGWPRGLYEPRPGYYTWRHPTTGETLPIGRVSLAVAKSEALAANLHVEGLKPSLIERVASNSKTVADVLDKMPAAKTDNTLRTCQGFLVTSTAKTAPTSRSCASCLGWCRTRTPSPNPRPCRATPALSAGPASRIP